MSGKQPQNPVDEGQLQDCPSHISPWMVVFIVCMAYLVLFVIILIFFLMRRLLFGKPKKKRIERVWNHHRYHHYLHPYCHRSIHTGHPCHHHDGEISSAEPSQAASTGTPQTQPFRKGSDPHQGPYPKALPVKSESELTKLEKPSNVGHKIVSKEPADKNEPGTKKEKPKKTESKSDIHLSESEQSLTESDQYERRKREKERPVANGGAKEQAVPKDVSTRTHPFIYKRNNNDDKDDAHKGAYPKTYPIN